MAIQTITKQVYRSSLYNKTFITLRGAIRAEARALITKKYPYEKAEYGDFGFQTYSGFYWAEDEHCKKLYKRLVRILTKKQKNNKGE